jgi:hypothetical protein
VECTKTSKDVFLEIVKRAQGKPQLLKFVSYERSNKTKILVKILDTIFPKTPPILRLSLKLCGYLTRILQQL